MLFKVREIYHLSRCCQAPVYCCCLICGYHLQQSHFREGNFAGFLASYAFCMAKSTGKIGDCFRHSTFVNDTCCVLGSVCQKTANPALAPKSRLHGRSSSQRTSIFANLSRHFYPSFHDTLMLINPRGRGEICTCCFSCWKNVSQGILPS